MTPNIPASPNSGAAGQVTSPEGGSSGRRTKASLFDTVYASAHLAYLISSTLVGAVLAVIAGAIDRTGDSVLALARIWSRGLLATARVKITIHQEAPLDPAQPYVFMANHVSSVDIWALFAAVPVNFRFIAKKQLGKIPIFGWAMAAGRFIFIDRQNPAASRRSIERAAERIRTGSSVAIFPEGTRSQDGLLAPFKKGGFHLAAESRVPIVPIGIRGAREIMPRGSFLLRRGHVEIYIGAAIPSDAIVGTDRATLVADVRAKIGALCGQPLRPLDS